MTSPTPDEEKIKSVVFVPAPVVKFWPMFKVAELAIWSNELPADPEKLKPKEVVNVRPAMTLSVPADIDAALIKAFVSTLHGVVVVKLRKTASDTLGTPAGFQLPGPLKLPETAAVQVLDAAPNWDALPAKTTNREVQKPHLLPRIAFTAAFSNRPQSLNKKNDPTASRNSRRLTRERVSGPVKLHSVNGVPIQHAFTRPFASP